MSYLKLDIHEPFFAIESLDFQFHPATDRIHLREVNDVDTR